jgi:large-conductance mechanosensitive channel
MVFNKEEFKHFIIDNNIIGTSAGVCVALAAKDGIQSLVGDIIIPAIILFLRTLHIDILTKYLPIKGSTQFKITDFVKQMITFILIVIISFVFVKITFGYLLGINIKKNDINLNNATTRDPDIKSTSNVKFRNF